MPPRAKIDKGQIINAAINLIRQNGADALSARDIAKELGASTQPIFYNYRSMKELWDDITQRAWDIYSEYTRREMERGEYPPCKASGMAYICFARDERELFKLLFMRDRSSQDKGDGFESVDYIIDIVRKNLNIDRETAKFFHLEMWVFSHGIAVMYATSYLELDIETVGVMLTDMYEGLKRKYIGGECHA